MDRRFIFHFSTGPSYPPGLAHIKGHVNIIIRTEVCSVGKLSLQNCDLTLQVLTGRLASTPVKKSSIVSKMREYGNKVSLSANMSQTIHKNYLNASSPQHTSQCFVRYSAIFHPRFRHLGSGNGIVQLSITVVTGRRGQKVSHA